MHVNVYWIIAVILLLASLAGMIILFRRRHSRWGSDIAESEESSGSVPFPDSNAETAEYPVWGRVDVMVEGKRISTQRIHLTTTIIGRDTGRAQIVIPELIVSKQHCVLFEKEGDLWIRDVGSTNGVFRDGGAVEEGEVRHGSVFSLGRRGSVKLVFYTDPPLDS